MASSVHYKFKSQKELSRVTFDGTGISVFELKREIIRQSCSEDASDFDLFIYDEFTNEEYEDDSVILPRSTSVIARRSPTVRPGRGDAARYVTGRMQVNHTSHGKADTFTPAVNSSAPRGIQSEEDKIAAMFNVQESKWKEQQQEMSHATPIFQGRGRGKASNVPDHPPPAGYICFRCREKGHWIQECPTNNDPTYDGRNKIKRATGIPRAFQKQVEKPPDGTDEDSTITGVMLNAEGEYVIAQPDKASWELHEEKQKAAAQAASEKKTAEDVKELHSRGLLCPIDQRMFLEPTKTPCCGKIYCSECINNALIESDFVCPNCSTEGVLLDHLVIDTDTVEVIKQYQSEKTTKKEALEAEKPRGTSQEPAETATALSPSSKPPSTTKSTDTGSSADQNRGEEKEKEGTENNSKKRPAEEAIHPTANGESHEMKRRKSNDSQQSKTRVSTPVAADASLNAGTNSKSKSPLNGTANPQFPPLSVPPFPPNSMSMMMPPFMPGMPAMPDGSWQQQQAPFIPPVPNGFPNNYDGMMGMPPMNPMMNGGPAAGQFFPNQMPITPNYASQHQAGFFPNAVSGGYGNQTGMGYGANSNGGSPFPPDEENAYMRQPVNPYRHFGRQKRARPTDYREL